MTAFTAPPTAPSTTDPANFSTRADALVAWFATHVAELNAAGVANVGNATTLLGKTWDAPGAIGGTTPAAGAFTTLSGTGAVNFGSTLATTGQIVSGGGVGATGGASSLYSAGVAASLIGNIGAAAGFRLGFGANLSWDGANWRTGTDGGSNGGFGILTNYGTGTIEFVPVAATGGANQSIANGSLVGKMTLDPTGVLTALNTFAQYNADNSEYSTSSALFYRADGGINVAVLNGAGGGYSSSGFVLGVSKNTSTSRSINAAGTLNASGADYAEYERKASPSAEIAKAQIVGFDAEGLITDQWAAAVSFGVKSTDPSLVGGDDWGTEDAVGMPLPREPKLSPPEYAGPSAPVELGGDADEAATAEYERALALYREAMDAHAQKMRLYEVDFAADVAQYEFDRERFFARVEAARARVDRVAYSGKVPVAVRGASVGDYIVPVQDGNGISGVALQSPTFEQYRMAVGQVRRIFDADASARLAARAHIADPLYFVGMAEIAVKVA